MIEIYNKKTGETIIFPSHDSSKKSSVKIDTLPKRNLINRLKNVLIYFWYKFKKLLIK